MSGVQVVYRLPITDVISIDPMPKKCHESLSLTARFCGECGAASPLQVDPNRSLKSGFTGRGSILIHGRDIPYNGVITLGPYTNTATVNGWLVDIPSDLKFVDKYDCRHTNGQVHIIAAEGASNIKQALKHTESLQRSLADNGLHFNDDDLIVIDTKPITVPSWMEPSTLLC